MADTTLAENITFAAPPSNDAVDFFTKNPVDKMTLLSNMKDCFGLAYEVRNAPAGVNATGLKMNYFSRNRRAEKFGYCPSKKSLNMILDEVCIMRNSEIDSLKLSNQSIKVRWQAESRTNKNICK